MFSGCSECQQHGAHFIMDKPVSTTHLRRRNSAVSLSDTEPVSNSLHHFGCFYLNFGPKPPFTGSWTQEVERNHGHPPGFLRHSSCAKAVWFSCWTSRLTGLPLITALMGMGCLPDSLPSDKMKVLDSSKIFSVTRITNPSGLGHPPDILYPREKSIGCMYWIIWIPQSGLFCRYFTKWNVLIDNNAEAWPRILLGGKFV